jgi:hypothetical protein
MMALYDEEAALRGATQGTKKEEGFVRNPQRRFAARHGSCALTKGVRQRQASSYLTSGTRTDSCARIIARTLASICT